MAQLVVRSTPDRCVVDSSPTHGTEHFGFPPSAPRLGNQRHWYVQPRMSMSLGIFLKDPVPLIEKRRGLSPGGHSSSDHLAMKIALVADTALNHHSLTSSSNHHWTE